MSEAPDESVAQLEDQLDGASGMLSCLDALNARQAERVAARMDRLASQLMEVSPPPAAERRSGRRRESEGRPLRVFIDYDDA